MTRVPLARPFVEPSLHHFHSFHDPAPGFGSERTHLDRTVRKRGVQDGPYADTKQQLGGFTIIEVPSIGKKIDPRTVTTLPRDYLLLFPVRKSKIVPLENVEACQSIFNGLPFRSVIRALRNGLKTIEDCGFCGRNSLS